MNMPIVNLGWRLVNRVLSLCESSDDRIIIGVTGPPAAGKSLISQSVFRALESVGGPTASVLPMDGFHMTNDKLAIRGISHRKGAPETFEAMEFIKSLRRVAVSRSAAHWPSYSRVLHDPVPDAISVSPSTDIVFVEGNYLALNDDPWRSAYSLYDELWYVDIDPDRAVTRLRARHLSGGMDGRETEAHIYDVDLPNGDQVRSCRSRATIEVVLHRTDRLIQGVRDPATGPAFDLGS